MTRVTYSTGTTMALGTRGEDGARLLFFGDSFVYVLFEGDTGPLLARLARIGVPSTRRQERSARGWLHTLGRNATGVGWITVALVDRSGQHDLAPAAALQDWFLKYEN